MKTIRIALNAEDFSTLVTGGIVKSELPMMRPEDLLNMENVEIILSDIGFAAMAESLKRAFLDPSVPSVPSVPCVPSPAK